MTTATPPTTLTETERDVIRLKAAQSGIDSVILYVERLLASRLPNPHQQTEDSGECSVCMEPWPCAEAL